MILVKNKEPEDFLNKYFEIMYFYDEMFPVKFLKFKSLKAVILKMNNTRKRPCGHHEFFLVNFIKFWPIDKAGLYPNRHVFVIGN